MSNQEQDAPGTPGAQAGEDAPATPGPGISNGNQSPGQQLLVGPAEGDLGFPPQGGPVSPPGEKMLVGRRPLSPSPLTFLPAGLQCGLGRSGSPRARR